jgi:pseudaminic acid cytidylyltransferase
MNVAIIPARGGSKRIPYKNIKPFCGKPMIAYAIDAAKDSGLFDEIVVSTDDEAIADVARQYGASVPFMRPAALADDITGTTPVVHHALKMIEAEKKYQYACCIYATCPLIQISFLRQAYRALEQEPGKSFAFSMTSFAFPVQRALKIEPNIEPLFPEFINQRSQDLVEGYHDAGQFYWGRVSAYMQGLPMFSDHAIPIILPRYLVQDIDTEEDWAQAELLYKAYIQHQTTSKNLCEGS